MPSLRGRQVHCSQRDTKGSKPCFYRACSLCCSPLCPWLGQQRAVIPHHVTSASLGPSPCSKGFLPRENESPTGGRLRTQPPTASPTFLLAPLILNDAVQSGVDREGFPSRLVSQQSPEGDGSCRSKFPWAEEEIKSKSSAPVWALGLSQRCQWHLLALQRQPPNTYRNSEQILC